MVVDSGSITTVRHSIRAWELRKGGLESLLSKSMMREGCTRQHKVGMWHENRRGDNGQVASLRQGFERERKMRRRNEDTWVTQH